MGFVPACFEVVPYSRKETIQPDGFDGLKCLTVDPSRTTVPLGYTVGLFEDLIGPGPSLRARFAARPSAVPYDPIRLPDAYPSISHSRL